MGVSSRARGTDQGVAQLRTSGTQAVNWRDLWGVRDRPTCGTLSRYLARRAESLGNGLHLEVDGRRLPLQAESSR